MEQCRRHSAVRLLSDDKSSIYVLQLVTVQYTDLAPPKQHGAFLSRFEQRNKQESRNHSRIVHVTCFIGIKIQFLQFHILECHQLFLFFGQVIIIKNSLLIHSKTFTNGLFHQKWESEECKELKKSCD